MKTYTEFETEQELRDYLNSLNGVNVEMEVKAPKGFKVKEPHKGKWYPFLSSDVRNFLDRPMFKGFKARVPRNPSADGGCKDLPLHVRSRVLPIVVTDEPHAELRKQYEEDRKWYNEPWELWQTMVGDNWCGMLNAPLWYRNQEYQRTEPTVTMPDGTVLPRPVDKVPAGANWYKNGVIDAKYKTEEDRIRVARYINNLAKLARGEKL